MPAHPRPRRSVLYMPGSNARALEKARTLPADGLILDLEDAVAPDAKDAARQSALNALGVQYAALDILPDPRIREELSGLSNWPTIPQLYVKGELVGGCDIACETAASGELAGKAAVQPGAATEPPRVKA